MKCDIAITIVTPSYNQGRFIRATIESVLRQHHQDVEYLILDSCSTDETATILDEYRANVALVIQEKDDGQADAISKGFRLARGNVLSWINADDLLEPDAASAAAWVFANRPWVDVVYGDIELIDSSGRSLGVVPSIDMHRLTFLLENSIIPQPGTFMRASAYARAGGVDKAMRFCMDFDLWARLIRTGAKFERINQVVAKFRLHGQAKTATIPEVQRQEHQAIVARELGRRPTIFERTVLAPVLRARRLGIQALRLAKSNAGRAANQRGARHSEQ